jgi:hypothetical protein
MKHINIFWLLLLICFTLTACNQLVSTPDTIKTVESPNISPGFTALPVIIQAESDLILPAVTKNNIELIVNWAYFDEFRIGIEYTVSGNFVPEGYSVYCPVVESKVTTDEDGISFYPYIWNSQHPINDQSTFSCTALKENQQYRITQNFSRSDQKKINAISINLFVNVGGFDAHGENGSTFPIPETTFNSNPIEIYLSVGYTSVINQIIEKDGIIVDLQSFELNPSVSYLSYCVNTDNHKEWEMDLSVHWNDTDYPADIPYRLGLGENIDLTYAQVLTEKRCYRIPFIFPYDGQADSDPTRKLTIEMASIKINYLDPPTQEDCQANLLLLQQTYPELDYSCSIEDINQQGYKFSLLINQLPPNLDEATAHQIIEESFVKTIPLGITQEILVP